MTITAPTDARASSGLTDEPKDDRPVLLAVSYLRVSTREQAERGGTDEGRLLDPRPARGQREEGRRAGRTHRAGVRGRRGVGALGGS